MPINLCPRDFICTVLTHNHLKPNGQLGVGEEPLGGTIAVNRISGSVVGDSIFVPGDGWKVVSMGDTENSAKFIYTDGHELATFVIQTYKPTKQGGQTVYPFLFVDHGTLHLISGTCRGTTF